MCVCVSYIMQRYICFSFYNSNAAASSFYVVIGILQMLGSLAANRLVSLATSYEI